MKSSPLKQHQTAILTAGIASIVLPFVPGLQWLLLPLVYLNTHIHELCHALTAEVTGGSVSYIKVFGNGAGVTYISGGSALLTNAAGYVGAALVGALIMWRARTDGAARAVLFGLGVFLMISMLIWVRGDAVGVASGLTWIGILAALIRFGKGSTLIYAAQFIGLQQCLHSAQSLNELLKISAMTQGDSDARNMQAVSGIPAIFWAVGWCAFSLLMVWVGLHRAWTTAPESRPSRPAS